MRYKFMDINVRYLNDKLGSIFGIFKLVAFLQFDIYYNGIYILGFLNYVFYNVFAIWYNWQVINMKIMSCCKIGF